MQTKKFLIFSIKNFDYKSCGNDKKGTYPKCAVRLLNRNCVNRRGPDISKEVLWVFVGQIGTVLSAVKVVGKKKFLPQGPVQT